MQGCNEGGDGPRPTGGRVIAVGFRDLSDQAVSLQQAQLPGDGAGLAALFRGCKLLILRKEELHQVPVAEAVEVKLAPGHRLKKRQVFRSIGI